MSSAEHESGKAHHIVCWLILAAAGSASFWFALDFGLGTATSIGSGVFPLTLSGIIVLLSLYSLIFGGSEGSPEPLAWRPLVAVAGSVVLFIVLVERLGMFPTVLLSMLVAYSWQTEGGYGAFVLYAVMFASGAWLLFTYLLRVPVPFIELG